MKRRGFLGLLAGAGAVAASAPVAAELFKRDTAVTDASQGVRVADRIVSSDGSLEIDLVNGRIILRADRLVISESTAAEGAVVAA